MSFVGRIGEVSPHDAVLVQILEQQGAILYCRTNMSQGMWFCEGYNNVYKRTLNPFNVSQAPSALDLPLQCAAPLRSRR
jgi:amidase